MIEIRKAGFVNKGAELMLYAVLEKMKKEFPDAKFCMVPSASAPYEKRIVLGFYQKVNLWKKGIRFGNLVYMVPKKLRDRYGLVMDSEVDIVLDAAGFSYSDQWGKGSTAELASSAKSWKKNGAKVVLLPQALGPYESAINKNSIKKAVENIDLIFARERISYEYITNAVGKRDNIKLAPDFTNLIEGIVPDDFDANTNRFCIVPNYRMIDKTSKEQSEAYLPFMITCARYLLEKDQKPFILVHEGANDLMLANKINDAVDGKLNIIKEAHPLKIKGILGVCEGTIGSRFHGLVSALSQGVPSLATGWSHKYKMLFEDYGFADGLLDVTASKEEVHKKIDLIIDEANKSKIKNIIESRSIELKKLSEQMWDDVMRVLRD